MRQARQPGHRPDHPTHRSARPGITVVAVSDATAVYEPFAVGRCQQAQDDALSYLRSYHSAEVTSASALL